jgi:hypothetical protein
MERVLTTDPTVPTAQAIPVDGPLICGHVFNAIDALGKWPGESPDLPWYYDFTGYRGPLSVEQLVGAFEGAWRNWAEAIDIRPRRVMSRAEAKVWGTFSRIDGGSGTLAWSMLANNTDRPLEQRYDNGENWVWVNPADVDSGIDIQRVIEHEVGHALGLDHDGFNANALMRPSYSGRIPKCTPRDIQRMLGLGYRPAKAGPPPPPIDPPPPPVTSVSIKMATGGLLTAQYVREGGVLKPGTIHHPRGWRTLEVG